MSNKDDVTAGDKELQSFLDGKDGVAAAYHELAVEEPPRELDALILRAAHQGSSKQQAKGRPWQAMLSLAASLVVGMMIGSVFLGNLNLQETTVSTAAFMASEVSTVNGPQATELAEIPANAKAVASADVAVSDVSSALVIVNAAERQQTGRSAPATRPALAVAESFAPRREETEEIVVTGSRIAEREVVPVAYRSTVVEWLEEIAYLRLSITELQTELETENGNLNEEEQLFRQAYPQLDLDTELDALDQD